MDIVVLIRCLLLAAALLSCIPGCTRAPTRITAPSWEPAVLADAILAKLDKNSDSSLDKSELAAAPGLAWGSKPIDTDKNGSLSRDELVARFELYKKMRIGITSKQFQVFHNNRPLAGVKIQLVPEFFLDQVVEAASGETSPDGYLDPLVAELDPPGMRVGYYRVVVESPNARVPAKYASAETTTLGVEVSPVGDDQASYGTIQILIPNE